MDHVKKAMTLFEAEQNASNHASAHSLLKKLDKKYSDPA
jgi:hypothetical protein